mmetsp:Transcript_14717/g.44906  ORF Transcript_14717/g.44906 Transcript_14717/m.44906 type:complete len:322 (+) Transcript_14717:742-1707(+)
MVEGCTRWRVLQRPLAQIVVASCGDACLSRTPRLCRHSQQARRRGAEAVPVIGIAQELLGFVVGHLLAHGPKKALELEAVDVVVPCGVEELEGGSELLLLLRVSVQHGHGLSLLRRHLLGRLRLLAGHCLGLELAELARVGLHGREELEEAEGELELLVAEGLVDYCLILHHPNRLDRHERGEQVEELREGGEHGEQREREHEHAEHAGFLQHLLCEDLHEADDVHCNVEEHGAHKVDVPLRPAVPPAKGKESLMLVHVLGGLGEHVLWRGLGDVLADLLEGGGRRGTEELLDAAHVAREELEKRVAEPAPQHENDAHDRV